MLSNNNKFSSFFWLFDVLIKVSLFRFVQKKNNTRPFCNVKLCIKRLMESNCKKKIPLQNPFLCYLFKHTKYFNTTLPIQQKKKKPREKYEKQSYTKGKGNYLVTNKKKTCATKRSRRLLSTTTFKQMCLQKRKHFETDMICDIPFMCV